MRLRLRSARWEDRQLLFDWASDPVVRNSSFNSAPILWESHLQWFAAKLTDPRVNRIFIAELIEGGPVGQIRFSRSGTDAEIGYSVASEHRGMGYGELLLAKGCRRILAFWPDVSRIVGEVKRENVASMRAFERLGFQERGDLSGPARYVWSSQNRRIVIATPLSQLAVIKDGLGRRLSGSFDWVPSPDAISLESLRSARPSYVFLILTQRPWLTASGLQDHFDCVLIQSDDLAIWQGAASLHQLVSPRVSETTITARLVGTEPGVDEWLLGRSLSLEGAEEDILPRATRVIEEMIYEIIVKDLAGGAPD